MNALCPKCKNKKPDVRYTVDVAGNILLPVSWASILEDVDPSRPGKKRNREISGSTDLCATKGGSKRIQVPSDSFLSSSTNRGGRWPGTQPLFEITPGTESSPWLEFWGEADELESVLRVSRRQIWSHRCDGGADVGQACQRDAKKPCNQGACVASGSPAYFACVSSLQPARDLLR